MEKEIIVLKYGSSSVTNAEGIDTSRLSAYSNYVDSLMDDYNIVIVSSGAVAAGKAYWETLHSENDNLEPSKQSFAMLGSGRIVSAWQDSLADFGRAAGQLLVTHRELDDVEEGSVVVSSIRQSLESDIIPICNENDALSIQELALLKYGGENDGLASHIARTIGAKALCLLNDSGGIMRNDHSEYESIRHTNWSVVRSMAKMRSEQSSQGTGGISAKVEAAISAASAGIDVYVGNAQKDPKIIMDGKSGTHFVAKAAEVR